MSDGDIDLYICPHCKSLLPTPGLMDTVKDLIGTPIKCSNCKKSVRFKEMIPKSNVEYAEDIGIATALRKYEPSIKLDGFFSNTSVYLGVSRGLANDESIMGAIRVLGPKSNASFLDHKYDALWITTERLLHIGTNKVDFISRPFTVSYQYSLITSISHINGGLFERPSIKISLSSGNIDEFIVPKNALVGHFVNDVREMTKNSTKMAKNNREVSPIISQLEKLSSLYKQGLLNDEEYRQAKEKLLS